MYVDNASMRMIQEPKFFDVMVTENTFGDILTDEGSCISGSMGLLPSASTGESTPVFEPIHGSWPQAKGLNIANPLAQILSVAMLFEYFDLKEEGALIREAVDADHSFYTPKICRHYPQFPVFFQDFFQPVCQPLASAPFPVICRLQLCKLI